MSTGTKCDECNKIMDREEDLRPVGNNTKWLQLSFRFPGMPVYDFCCKKCLINYLPKIGE